MSRAPLEVAVDAARRAGAYLRAHRGRAREVTLKAGGDFNMVTEIDRGAEAMVVEAIRAAFPHHAILAEESGASAGTDRHRWVIDPLDGTTNFVHGVPLFCVSIGLEVDGTPTVGVVYDPNLDECFTAERGRGARLGEVPLAVSATAELGASLLATGFPYDVHETGGNLAEYAALTRRSRIVRELGSAAISLAWVAAGRLDGYWEKRLGPWDVAAGRLLVEEAGGRITSLQGGPLDALEPRVVATNGRIHDALVGVLGEIARR
jgi:myo-inositol-1(or 4)-monophosphatase